MTSLAIVFHSIAIIFLTTTLRDYLRAEGKMSIARKIWLRMVLIFTGVTIGLSLLNLVLN